MKTIRLFLVWVLVLCFAVLCGCASSGGGSVDHAEPSDKELIESLLKDDDLTFWMTANAPGPYTQERFEALCQRCPDLDALMERDTGTESLSGYGPELIRQYHGSEQGEGRLRALALADLIGYLCPELATDMEALVTELTEE